MKTVKRFLTNEILQAFKSSPIVFINGPRQSGKSTLVQQLAPEIGGKNTTPTYLSFDRPTLMAAAAAEPEAFLAAYDRPLIIDEVQMVPELFRALKIAVDESRLEKPRNVNGKFLLTGSANILALPKLSDPLVGRMSVKTLYPFCTAETNEGKGNGVDRLVELNFGGITDRGLGLLEAIRRSTFPEIADKGPKERHIWFDGYLTTILQRDVRQLAELDKIAQLPNLLRVLAIRAGNLINDSDIGRDLGMNPVTTKSYKNVLKLMFLYLEIPPWFRNIGKRLVKSPKGFLLDTLMLSHLLDMGLEEMERNRPDLFGHLLENYVAMELTKLLGFSKVTARLLHFRTSDGKEVDFVLEKQDGSILAIEVKKSELVSIKDFKGIRSLAELAPDVFIGGVVLYSGKEVVPFGKGLWAVPFHVLWQ